MTATTVQNMVCSLCDHWHGQEHRPTCPRLYPDNADYEVAFLAGKNFAYEAVTEFRRRLQDVLDRCEEHGIEMPEPFVELLRVEALL